MFFRKMKVKTKIITLLIFIAYFSVLLTSLVSYTVGRNIINERIQSELVFASQTILKDINNLVYDRYNDMQLLISDSVLSDSNSTTNELDQVLQSTLIRLGWYDNLYFTDTQGTIIASTNRIVVSESVAEQNWYKETQRSFIFVSDVLPSPFSNKSILIFANTVVDENNAPIGTVFAEFSMDLINDFLKETPPEFEIFLLNAQSSIIATKGDITTTNQYSSSYPREIAKNSSYIVENIVSEGYLAFDGNGWEIVVQIPKSIAYDPLDRFAMLIWLTVVVISLEVMFVGNLAAKRFVRPILELTEGVSKMAEGDLHQKIEVDTEDEFGYLAKNFNSMSQSLTQKTNDLLTERGKYRSILESSNDGVVLFNTSNQVIAFNNRFTEILKIHPRMGDSAKDTFSFLERNQDPGSTEKLSEIHNLIETKDFEKSMSVEVTLSNGGFKILSTYSKPVKSKEGTLLGRIWVFSDVTEEREAENSRNEFIQIASHKLRTPITAINWIVQMLTGDDDYELSEEVRSSLTDIALNADRLNSLTKILLNSAEIKHDTIVVHPKPISLSILVQEAHQKISRRFPDRNIVNIKVPSPEEMANLMVYIDEDKIEQVFSIILENACVYGKPKELNNIELTIQTNLEEKTIDVCVKDSGIGILADEKRKIFTKFFRGSNAKLKYTEGTGLSLFLARIILTSSGQKIWFNSIANQGSEFCFTLPLVSDTVETS